MSETSLRKLDRSQPFGEISHGLKGRYEQHGILFDCNDYELPGFEDVKIPDPPLTPLEDALRKLDAANLENNRLQAEIERLSALNPPG